MRVVLDTDVVVAGIRSRSGASRLWLRAALTGRVDLLLSVPLALQYEEVLTRPAQLQAAGIGTDDMLALLDALVAVAVPVEISFMWRPSLKDVTDEMVLEAAVAGGADQLLTFNVRDFANAERFGIRAVTPGEGLATARSKGVDL